MDPQNFLNNPGSSQSTQPAAQLSTSEEHTWAMLAHLSVFLNLFSGFLGIVVALVIYLAYKNHSRYVAYQSMQAFIFQCICWLGGGILAAIAWAVTGILSMIIIGVIFIPIACVITLIPLASVAYSIVGAVQCSNGQDFRYWLVGDWVRGELTKA